MFRFMQQHCIYVQKAKYVTQTHPFCPGWVSAAPSSSWSRSQWRGSWPWPSPTTGWSATSRGPCATLCPASSSPFSSTSQSSSRRRQWPSAWTSPPVAAATTPGCTSVQQGSGSLRWRITVRRWTSIVIHLGLHHVVHHLDLGDLHLASALPHPALPQHHHLQEAQGAQGNRSTGQSQATRSERECHWEDQPLELHHPAVHGDHLPGVPLPPAPPLRLWGLHDHLHSQLSGKTQGWEVVITRTHFLWWNFRESLQSGTCMRWQVSSFCKLSTPPLTFPFTGLLETSGRPSWQYSAPGVRRRLGSAENTVTLNFIRVVS